jgi:antitoxin component YwqK of YwqJK toxin-antitoxin module
LSPETPVSTAAAQAPAESPAVSPATGDEKRARFVFISVPASDGNRTLVYYEGGVATATETLNAAGVSVSVEGAIGDGVYSEYYPDGAVKTLKPLSAGRISGSLKTFYPSGTPQIEAQYLAGTKNGAFRFFSEDGAPLMEAAYVNDKLNGWKKEYGPDGSLKTELYYADDRAADPPKSKAETAQKDEDSSVTVKVARISRGEILSFSLNGKYIGKARLDKEFNVITQEGKVPDGAAKVYGADGKLQKELLFKGNEIKIIRLYDETGDLRAAYTLTEGLASKFSGK